MNKLINKQAEDYALTAGYPQSDKETIEITYWSLHNKVAESFEKGAESMLPIIKELIEALHKESLANSIGTTPLIRYNSTMETFKEAKQYFENE